MPGEFDDCERMERFDVAFARIYLDAAERFESAGEVPRSWRVVFDAPPSALAAQHLMAGMNAHIDLDLGSPPHRSRTVRRWESCARTSSGRLGRPVAALGGRILNPPPPLQWLTALVD